MINDDVAAFKLVPELGRANLVPTGIRIYHIIA